MIKFSFIDRRLIFLFVSAGHILKSISAACFTPNGTNRNLMDDLSNPGKNRYQPCNTNAEFSMCCGSYGVPYADRCRGDGLCVTSGGDGLWRDSCTDPTWQSSSCLKLCIQGTGVSGNPELWGDEIITECPDESLCCGKGNTACCAAQKGVWIKDGEISNVNPFTNSSTASSTAASTAASIVASIVASTGASTGSTTSSTSFISSSTMSTPRLSSPSGQHGSASSRSNTGAIIGGVAGGVVIGIALGACIIWFILRRRKLSGLQQSASPLNVVSSMERDLPQPHEIDGRQRDHEVDGRELVEISDNAVYRLTTVPDHT